MKRKKKSGIPRYVRVANGLHVNHRNPVPTKGLSELMLGHAGKGGVVAVYFGATKGFARGDCEHNLYVVNVLEAMDFKVVILPNDEEITLDSLQGAKILYCDGGGNACVAQQSFVDSGLALLLPKLKDHGVLTVFCSAAAMAAGKGRLDEVAVQKGVAQPIEPTYGPENFWGLGLYDDMIIPHAVWWHKWVKIKIFSMVNNWNITFIPEGGMDIIYC